MNLKRYRSEIKDQLLEGIKQSIKHENAIANGDYMIQTRIPKGNPRDKQ